MITVIWCVDCGGGVDVDGNDDDGGGEDVDGNDDDNNKYDASFVTDVKPSKRAVFEVAFQWVCIYCTKLVLFLCSLQYSCTYNRPNQCWDQPYSQEGSQYNIDVPCWRESAPCNTLVEGLN